jgi:hypothetical protein
MDAGLAAVNPNLLAVLVAALLGFAIGGVWYGPLFGKAWMGASGMTEERVRAGNPLKIYGLTFVLNLIAAFSLAMFIGAGDWRFGLFAGFMSGATFVAVGLGITYLFEHRPLRLWLINAGYQVLLFSAMGALLGAWH